MTKEIVEAVKALEQEKGISSDKLMDALRASKGGQRRPANQRRLLKA